MPYSLFTPTNLKILNLLLIPLDILLKIMLLPAILLCSLGIPLAGDFYLWPFVKLGLLDPLVFETQYFTKK